MSLLENIKGPGDLKVLPEGRLDELAGDIRRFLVDAVARTGGHLGPNLGVVELTIALHRVFDSPRTSPSCAARAACPGTPRGPSPSTT
jgi:1-deoxy-D-xylulose-5-phosphate synthase